MFQKYEASSSRLGEGREEKKRPADPEDARNIINAKRIAQSEDGQKTKWERVVKPDGKVVFRL